MNFGKQTYHHNFSLVFLTQPKVVGPLRYDNNRNFPNKGDDEVRWWLSVGYNKNFSYCKQIARQLRTQYVKGIYDNPVTLKSKLTVNQGHW